jgi:hypothetical protein
MHPSSRFPLALAFLLPWFQALPRLEAQSTPPPAPDGSWTKQVLTDVFWAEGSAVADVNRDGAPDVFYGPHWYAGPDFSRRHLVYPDTARFQAKQPDGTMRDLEGFKGAKTEENGYSNNFQSFAEDLDGDGWPDYVVVSFPGKETFWYQNPQGQDVPWKAHVLWPVTDNESPLLADVDGDGKQDLVCMSGARLGFATRNPSAPTDPWTWHPASPPLAFQRFTHGIGAGDVNGDGRTDLLEAGGWWEQPAAPGSGPWTRRDVPFADKGGAQMHVRDVNGDGKPDVIGSLAAHAYGLAWFEQTAEGWKRHLITGTPEAPGSSGIVFSQIHAIEMADMNGDGLDDIVTGKRFWAHGKKGDPEPEAPAVLWWFELRREGGTVTWTPHLIDADSGVGTQFTVTDLNGDGKPDVVTGNKKGCFVHLRQ